MLSLCWAEHISWEQRLTWTFLRRAEILAETLVETLGWRDTLAGESWEGGLKEANLWIGASTVNDIYKVEISFATHGLSGHDSEGRQDHPTTKSLVTTHILQLVDMNHPLKLRPPPSPDWPLLHLHQGHLTSPLPWFASHLMLPFPHQRKVPFDWPWNNASVAWIRNEICPSFLLCMWTSVNVAHSPQSWLPDCP